jgi:hypothetical protein
MIGDSATGSPAGTGAVSSYASVYLGNGRPVCAFRNGVDQLFFILFTRADWVDLEVPDAWRLAGDQYGIDESDARVVGFRTTDGVLWDRVDLLGPLGHAQVNLPRTARRFWRTGRPLGLPGQQLNTIPGPRAWR